MKQGKILWFDKLSGEGVLADRDRSYYFHWSSLHANPIFVGHERLNIDPGTDVEFSIYDNGHIVDKIKTN